MAEMTCQIRAIKIGIITSRILPAHALMYMYNIILMVFNSPFKYVYVHAILWAVQPALLAVCNHT